MKGRLVLDNCETIRQRLHDLLTPRVKKLYLHVKRLEFVDSAGWGMMVGLKMAAHRNKATLAFLAPNDRLKDIFRVSRLDSIFDIVEGSEAEMIRVWLEKSDHLVWRDSPDENQKQFNTEAYFTPVPEEGESAESAAPEEDALRSRRIQELSGQAIEFLRLSDYPSVIETYLKILDLDPEDLSALNNLGVIYEKRPEWRPKAEEAWREVLRLSRERNDQKHAQRAERHLEMLARQEV